jgi:hypothetical protein
MGTPEHETLHWLVPDGWQKSIHCPEAGGQGVRLLWYDNGEVRVEHKCIAGDGSEIINAPIINHDVQFDAEGYVTVSPSVLCLGCGLHGFIEHSRWRSA